MTLLVVDDEWYAVKGISEGIDWRGTEIDEVLEAFSAAEAMRILQERRVDVLLCDIEMPEMSGLELSRWCASHTPGIKILFLTGHASFPYANEAVRLQAFDYILKPVDHETLTQAVCRAARQARSDAAREKDALRWQEYSARLAAERPEHTRLFWRNVIDNRLNRESIHAWFAAEAGGAQPMPALVTPVAIYVDDEDLSTEEEALLRSALEEKLDQDLLQTARPGCRLRDPELETLLLLYGPWKTEIEASLHEGLAAIQKSLRCRLHWRAGETAAPEELWWSVYRLRRGAERTLPRGQGMADALDWETMLATTPEEQVHARADRVFAEAGEEGRTLRLQGEVLRLCGAARRIGDRCGVPTEAAQARVRELLALGGECTPALLQAVHRLLDACMQDLHACPDSDNAQIAAACRYIHTHLRQNLTRENIAAQVYLHPAYLSRLFKHEMGVTLTDYIAKARIDEACRLLRAPSVKIGAVGAQVGYPQFPYFCRVFRRITGMSPQAYRQKDLSDENNGR